MSPIEYFYLVLLVVFFGTVAGYAYKEFRKTNLKKNQYRLYEIRDNLIFLVANGDLKEKGVIFQEFYPLVNNWVQSVQKLNLTLLFKAFREARRDIESKEKIETLQKALVQSNEKVKEVVQQLFRTVLEIMVENSFTLKFLVKHVLAKRLIKIVAKKLYQSVLVSKERKQIYKDYKGYENIRTKVAYAH